MIERGDRDKVERYVVDQRDRLMVGRLRGPCLEGLVRKYRLWEMIVKDANGMYIKLVRWSSDEGMLHKGLIVA